MAEMYFPADFHLGHANIIRFCNRPFANCAEMGEAILSRLLRRSMETTSTFWATSASEARKRQERTLTECTARISIFCRVPAPDRLPAFIG